MTSKASPTIDDVAREAKVSTATISRAINEPEKVASQTRERIEKIIDKLGYTPHFGGRVLASNRTKTVGAVIPTMSNAMFASGLQAFQEVLSEGSYNLLVASSGYNSKSEFEQIKSLVAQGADALLLIGSSRPAETSRFLRLRKIPYVIAWSFQRDKNRYFAGFDNEKAAAAMTTEVLNRGHRNIAMIAGNAIENDRSRNRISGVKKTIADHKTAKLVSVIETEYTLEAGGSAFESLTSGSKKPTAVICGNDVLAAGAIMMAKKQAISVPEQISITGFDDISLAKVVSPTLTTVRVPQLEMGKEAARLVLQLLDHHNPSSCELQTEIVFRDSLGPVMQAK